MSITHLDSYGSTNADLIARFVAGDRDALAVLMARHNGLMQRAARHYLRSAADVSDAVQEAWASFATHAGSIREPERLVGWLRITAARAALGIATRNARLEPVADIESVPTRTTWIDSADSDTWTDRRRALRAALGQLNPRERRLVGLLAAEPRLSYREIATAMGCSIGSIGPTRQRICSKLARDPAIVRAALEGAA